MFNERLTRKCAARVAKNKKRAAKGGSQELNREASNGVAEPLGKNPDHWIPTVITYKA
jgi:hypothetical protein